MFDYYLLIHILAGYYTVDWFCKHVNSFATKVGKDKIVDDTKRVMAIYLFWPVLIPLLLMILHFNLPKRKT